MARRVGDAREPPQARVRLVARVATEQLVATVARERDRHVATRELAHERGRDLRRVGERLVVHLRQARDHRARLAGGDVQLGVVGPEVTGDGAGAARLVVAGLVEADRERADGPRALGLHERDDERRVDPAGQERADRDVGDHPQADALAQRGFHRVDRAGRPPVGGAGRRATLRITRGAVGPPVRDGLRRDAGRGRVDLDVRRGRELRDAPVDRARRGHVAEPQVAVECVAVDGGAERRVRAQGLRLRPEQERRTRPAVEQRLLAEPVAGKVQAPGRAVPAAEREHRVGALERAGDTPRGDRLEQHLGVGRAGEDRARAFELGPQRPVVVQLAVEDEHVPTVARRHRLVTGRRQVDDRQAPEPEGHARGGVGPHARVVGAAVRHRRGHAGRVRFELVAGRRLRRVQEAGDAAHQEPAPTASSRVRTRCA